MKTTLCLLALICSSQAMAAIGCLPGQCDLPKPRPVCPPSRPSGGRPLPQNVSLEINLLDSNEIKATPTGILIDSSWKNAIHDFAKKNVRHPSWGLSHAERNYQVTKVLAEKEKVELDLDVLFAASFLHDLGGLKGYEVEGVDHAVRSAELAENLLSEAGFPMDKWPAVKEIILGHTYYTAAPANKAAQLFRDADVLDFLGNIGVARILAITQEEGTSDSTLKPTVGILQTFAKSMAGKCISDACKELAKGRQEELVQFLNSLTKETFSGKAL
nr:HD domain-containing protein [Bacteriovorax sp. HI3]